MANDQLFRAEWHSRVGLCIEIDALSEADAIAKAKAIPWTDDRWEMYQSFEKFWVVKADSPIPFRVPSDARLSPAQEEGPPKTFLVMDLSIKLWVKDVYGASLEEAQAQLDKEGPGEDWRIACDMHRNWAKAWKAAPHGKG
jgi:hypothetical protein